MPSSEFIFTAGKDIGTIVDKKNRRLSGQSREWSLYFARPAGSGHHLKDYARSIVEYKMEVNVNVRCT